MFFVTKRPIFAIRARCARKAFSFFILKNKNKKGKKCKIHCVFLRLLRFPQKLGKVLFYPGHRRGSGRLKARPTVWLMSIEAVRPLLRLGVNAIAFRRLRLPTFSGPRALFLVFDAGPGYTYSNPRAGLMKIMGQRPSFQFQENALGFRPGGAG